MELFYGNKAIEEISLIYGFFEGRVLEMMQGENEDFAEIIWIVAEKDSTKRIPKWKRLVAYTPDNRVFVPAIIAGNEQEVFMCACFDGISCLADKGHIYAPTDWMSREFPATKETCAFIESKVKAFVGKLDND